MYCSRIKFERHRAQEKLIILKLLLLFSIIIKQRATNSFYKKLLPNLKCDLSIQLHRMTNRVILLLNKVRINIRKYHIMKVSWTTKRGRGRHLTAPNDKGKRVSIGPGQFFSESRCIFSRPGASLIRLYMYISDFESFLERGVYGSGRRGWNARLYRVSRIYTKLPRS